MLRRISQLDDNDPLGRSYRHHLRMSRNLLVILLVILGLTAIVGVPHLQTTFEFMGRVPSDGWTRSEQKLNAWYFSVTGFQHVYSGEYGHAGCPVLLFIPVEDCVDLSWIKQQLPFSLTRSQ